MRIDPPPSLAVAIENIPEATAAAAPPLEPPGEYAVCHGFLDTPYNCGSVTFLKPNSGALVCPNGIKPSVSNRWTK